MTELKPGDRVRVEFTATYAGVTLGYNATGGHVVGTRHIVGMGATSLVLPVDAVLIRIDPPPPPLKVGDVIEAEEDRPRLAGLPVGALIIDCAGDVGVRTATGWAEYSSDGHGEDANTNWWGRPIEVLRLPDEGGQS